MKKSYNPEKIYTKSQFEIGQKLFYEEGEDIKFSEIERIGNQYLFFKKCGLF